MVSIRLCCGFALVSMRIRIRMRIQIQGAKPMRIHGDPDPDPGQSWILSWKIYFTVCKYNVIKNTVLYHRERILETSTLSCNEEEEEITKPPTRWGHHAPPLSWVLFEHQRAPIHFPILPPPTYLQHQLIPPPPLIWVRGGPHTPPPLLTSNPQLRPRGLRTAF